MKRKNKGGKQTNKQTNKPVANDILQKVSRQAGLAGVDKHQVLAKLVQEVLGQIKERDCHVQRKRGSRACDLNASFNAADLILEIRLVFNEEERREREREIDATHTYTHIHTATAPDPASHHPW